MTNNNNTTTLPLRDEIIGEMILATSGDSIQSVNYEELANSIIKLFEKRIDSIEYLYDMEWHCENAVDYVKNELKELLNE